MKIKRTANAGVLIETDNIRILVDGVSNKVLNYEETPQSIKEDLCQQFPDVVMFTHYHDDHYDEDFSLKYKKDTLRSVYGPEFALTGKMGNVRLKGIDTRHIGKADIKHVSYVIDGEKCIWFMGDASPLELKKLSGEKKADILIVPYAYVTTKASWEIAKSMGAEKIILLHMPKRKDDVHNLWGAMEETVENPKELIVLNMGEEIEI